MAISRKRSSVVQAMKNDGFGNKEIEEKLGLSAASVRRYLRDSKQLKHPKILLVDIETSPVWVRVWGLWKQRVPFQNVIKEWFMISWSAKWLYDSEIIGECVTSDEAIARDDKRIVKSLWEVMNECDIIVAHNLLRFDLRKIISRFIQHNLLRPKPYRTIDTLVQARKSFAFSSNSLDYLNSMFSLRLKEDTDYDLWILCEEGDQESLDYMFFYNKSDEKALEELFLKLRPYFVGVPNLGVYVEDTDPMCPLCLSKDIIEDGNYTTGVSVFKSYRCLSCGGLSRGRESSLNKIKRRDLLVPVVR